MRITSFVIQKTGLTPAQLFGLVPLVKIMFDGEGRTTIPMWNVPGVAAPTASEIAAALTAPEPGPTAADLVAYATRKQTSLATGGYSFNVAASGATPIIVQADTTTDGRLNLSGLVQLTVEVPGFTTTWLQASGPITLTSSQIVALAVAVGKFFSATYAELSEVLAAIAAGSVTTYAEIDGASWPANAS